MLKENYFEFYGLPIKFFIDENQLRQKYLTISRSNHPDFFANDTEKQEEVMKTSAFNNKVYSTLKTFDSRLEYILAQSGLYDKEQRTALSQAFLMDMMEWNERLADAEIESKEAMSILKSEIQEEKSKIEAHLKILCASHDSQPSSEKLNEIAEVFEKQKYFLKLLSSSH
jgi:molecular chaperone HscB